MSLPSQLLGNLKDAPGYDEAAFVAVHEHREQVSSLRINPFKKKTGPDLPYDMSPVPWSRFGYYLQTRPAYIFDPLLHGGKYYVQEASSMFLEQALVQTADLARPLRVLDLCAAPGGKSTLIQSLISADSLLISNEIIRSRVPVLEENLVKWGASNSVVISNDPSDIGTALKDFFDIIIIDAPCSGSGLFRRESELVREWSEENVAMCSRRQRRILADIYPALKKDGLLIYSTCSYSKEEDEDIADWMSGEFDITGLSLSVPASWNIVDSYSEKNRIPGYRFYPYKVKGEGFFLCCFRKNDGGSFNRKPSKRSKLQELAKAELALVKPWLNDSPVHLWKQEELVLAFPESLSEELLLLGSPLYIKNAGILTGRLTAKELIPEHALALSNIVSSEIVGISLKKEEALQYLRKEEVKVQVSGRGWALVKFDGLNLGWVKLLQNRVNNYYPKEWRILKPLNN
jgi:16S rRNA C967 or C1407 C5-methylase (RsmB/RsmF family)/NOL1/NOP2/fmu family ribosome biogenesis protein